MINLRNAMAFTAILGVSLVSGVFAADEVIKLDTMLPQPSDNMAQPDKNAAKDVASVKKEEVVAAKKSLKKRKFLRNKSGLCKKVKARTKTQTNGETTDAAMPNDTSVTQE
ncbi:MAG: hypothetical protein KKE11_06265 [Gammaproteobacteria bacterium]|nr:hypothetical protein [Gammaproteobacteria bacterium]